jgi:tetraacyldisaccharide 4'-kinase
VIGSMQVIDLRKLKPLDDVEAPVGRLLRPLLLPLSVIYGGAVRLWRRLPSRVVDIGVPVVSVGSITVGGSGKTPLSMYMARELARRSLKVCILSRGYRRKGNTSPMLVSNGGTVFASVEEAGDEPYMMAKRLHGVSVIVGKDRLRSAIEASRLGAPAVFVLDDGFQYRRILKRLEIVCVDWRSLTGRPAMLPAGPLREGWSSIKANHIAVILMPSAEGEPAPGSLARIGAREIFRAHRTGPVLTDYKGTRLGADALNGGVVLVSGVARPESFENTCKEAGISAAAAIRYDDHHWYSETDADAIRDIMVSHGCDRLVTTEKDVHKLPVRLRQASLVLRTDLEIAGADRFWQIVESRLCL